MYPDTEYFPNMYPDTGYFPKMYPYTAYFPFSIRIPDIFPSVSVSLYFTLNSIVSLKISAQCQRNLIFSLLSIRICIPNISLSVSGSINPPPWPSVSGSLILPHCIQIQNISPTISGSMIFLLCIRNPNISPSVSGSLIISPLYPYP